MSASPLDSQVYGGLFTDAQVAACFSDRAHVQAMLDVEAALAKAQAKLGMIPAEVARRIAERAKADLIDPATLGADSAAAGIPVVALVKALRAAVGPEDASHVHLGATTQDILDTALVLQLRAALEGMRRRLDAVVAGLCDLAETHRATVMAGRTIGQQAVPITFGLKAAGWLAPLDRHRDRLDELSPRLFVVQFGGAAGTLAALGDRGLAVMEALAAELDLAPSTMPWHAQRDAVAEFASWLSLVSGSLAKMAEDIILLAQTEVAEVAESDDDARGGSSTMPHKRNPMTSVRIVAAARLNASLLAAVHQALVHEHERATHSWQLEWLTLPQMTVAAAGALMNAERLVGDLAVDAVRMGENIARGHGAVLAEALSYTLSTVMSRADAHARVRDAAFIAARDGRALADVVREAVGDDIAADAIDWDRLADPANYLGETDRIIDRVVARARRLASVGRAR